MTNQKKVLIGAGVLALAVGYFLYFNKKKPTVDVVVNEPAPVEEPVPTCGKPLVKCPTNNTCYDPNVNYLVDPCRSITA